MPKNKRAGSYTDYVTFSIKSIFFTAFMQIHVVYSRKKTETSNAFRVILLPLITSVLKCSWFQQPEETKINFSASLLVSVDVKQNERDHCFQNKWCLTRYAAKNMHLLFLALLKLCIPHRRGKLMNWRNGCEKILRQKHITEITMSKNEKSGSRWHVCKYMVEEERITRMRVSLFHTLLWVACGNLSCGSLEVYIFKSL